jgi:uroporphyrinogen-III synthase
MSGDLRGMRVALLEARMSGELASLVEKHGGVPYSVPAVKEATRSAASDVAALLDRLDPAPSPVFVLLTGVGVRALFVEAEQLGRKQALFRLLERATTVCRGPKPVAALKKEGIQASVRVKEPHTTTELLEALDAIPGEDRPWVVNHYGEKNAALIDRLSARGITPIELSLYEWQMPDDRTPLSKLVDAIIGREVGAVAFTSQIQVRHLFQIAEEGMRTDALRAAFAAHTIAAAVGPTCAHALEELGVKPQVVPEHPKMGPMVQKLVEYVRDR